MKIYLDEEETQQLLVAGLVSCKLMNNHGQEVCFRMNRNVRLNKLNLIVEIYDKKNPFEESAIQEKKNMEAAQSDLKEKAA